MPRAFNPFFCVRCGQVHAARRNSCVQATANSGPLETPSHNGKYRGRARVRVVPRGIAGTELAVKRVRKRGPRRK